MALTAEQVRLYLVTDPDLCAGYGLIETVLAAVQGGVTIVQLRDKTASTQSLAEQARALKTALAGTGVPVIVNDNVEACIAANADGVHVGQSDQAPRIARDMIGPDKILGLSCECLADVHAVGTAPVDYLGLGTVFGTQTKSDIKPTIGLDGLAAMAAQTHLPTVAIGGLKAAHTQAVLDAGCDGLAVVSAICGQADPTAAARAFFDERGFQ